MSDKKWDGKAESILWSIQQRMLEGQNEGPGGLARDGWDDAWADVAGAFAEFNVDPIDMPERPK